MRTTMLISPPFIIKPPASQVEAANAIDDADSTGNDATEAPEKTAAETGQETTEISGANGGRIDTHAPHPHTPSPRALRNPASTAAAQAARAAPVASTSATRPPHAATVSTPVDKTALVAATGPTSISNSAHILDNGLKTVAATESSTLAPEGNYPLGQSLMWHTGLHLQAPLESPHVYADVRAIADGKVIFVHPPRSKVSDADDPQAYNPFGDQASWTDNGMIIIEHETDIGAQEETLTTVKFYSAYMHLSQIKSGVAVNSKVFRKDAIGRPGDIYGHDGQIELSICCNTTELQHLIGRRPEWKDPKTEPSAHGRIDSVFGKTYIFLSARTPVIFTTPTAHHHNHTHGSTRLGTAQWVEIDYTKGQATLTTYRTDGSRGHSTSEPDFEYQLYKESQLRHDCVVKAGISPSSASGWFELLHFGRNLGRGPKPEQKDPLPENAVHWRKIKTVDGVDLWADLHDCDNYVFSEADFLPLMGWNCYGDDTKPNDQRCDSPTLKALIADPADPKSIGDNAALAQRIGRPDVLPKLARTICQFPNEWDRDTIATRYGCIKADLEARGKAHVWPPFEAHLNSLAMSNLPANFKAADWHFHPGEFIRTFKKCAWLSVAELKQLIPPKALRKSKGEWVSETVNPPSLVLTKKDDDNPWPDRLRELNRANRKFCVNNPSRMAAFYGNALQETQWLELIREGSNKFGNKDAQYCPWDGRGFFQLTWPDNYIKYFEFRGTVIDRRIKEKLNAAQIIANRD
ncbi:M23 family metallopeptidase, partial [Herbaspirillum sp. RTI4]|uniref:M23 family metallopeptidase n=1 Tax=Herbaspirillum sp. RTI4 TaxID=3048640 RepID=UPI002B22BE39